MRLWTLHPRYLDSKGLVALWREGLLARKVLGGGTVGYTRHPQLERFRAHEDPAAFIDAYLGGVLDESRERGYDFDASKIEPTSDVTPAEATTGQLQFEREHLLRKLQERDPERGELLRAASRLDPHPVFTMVEGDVAAWERT